MAMKKYILIKNYNSQDLSNIKDIVQGLLGNNVEFIETEYLTVIHDYSNDEDIMESMESIILDLQENIQVYLSKKFIEMKYLNIEKKIIGSYFEKNIFKRNIYDEKTFIKELVLQGYYKDLDKVVLGEYYRDSSMLEVLKIFAENNMNTSSTAEKVFMHRNTLINKLEKFHLTTGYDMKEFCDAFIIYHLI